MGLYFGSFGSIPASSRSFRRSSLYDMIPSRPHYNISAVAREGGINISTAVRGDGSKISAVARQVGYTIPATLREHGFVGFAQGFMVDTVPGAC